MLEEMATIDQIQEKYSALAPRLDERATRIWAAAEAETCGCGGQLLAHRAAGIARGTRKRGLRELDDPDPLIPSRIRHPGAGRKKHAIQHPGFAEELGQLVAPPHQGRPRIPLALDL